MISGLTTRHTIQRERPTATPDGRGGTDYDFTDAVLVDLPGWALDSGATVEDLDHRDGAQIEWTARGPYLADVERHDRVTVLGERYRIEGGVRRQPGPTGLTSHTILLLKRWEG